MNKETVARLGWLDALLADEETPPADKMEGILAVLGEVRAEKDGVSEGFISAIEREQAKLAKAVGPYDEVESGINKDIWRILEASYPDQRHDGDRGTVQIIRPKNRISYDVDGLETLRKSSDKVQRLVGLLRAEKPSTPYLKLKLK